MDELNINNIDLNELEQIPIPEGLEERLSRKIDEWEKETLSTTLPRHGEGDRSGSLSLRSKPNGSPHYGGDVRRTERVFSWTAIAASIALLMGLGYYTFTRVDGDAVTAPPLAERDTYHDPLLAQQEAERALTLLAVNLNKGMTQLEKAQTLSRKTEQTLNKQLKALE